MKKPLDPEVVAFIHASGHSGNDAWRILNKLHSQGWKLGRAENALIEHPMELALKDVLILSFENDKEMEGLLHIALPHFIKFHDRAMDELDMQWRIEYEHE